MFYCLCWLLVSLFYFELRILTCKVSWTTPAFIIFKLAALSSTFHLHVTYMEPAVQCKLRSAADVPPSCRLAALCALVGSDRSGEGGGGWGRAAAPRTHSPHFQRRPTFRLQHFLPSSCNKTSGAEVVRRSGTHSRVVPRTWFAFYSAGRPCKRIAVGI